MAMLSFDVVVLTRGKVSEQTKTKLAGCFDRIIPVQDFGRTPNGVADNAYISIVRAKFWAFSLTEYKRVQFMDADQMIIRNLDHYFFRQHYTVAGIDVRKTTKPVRKFYTQVSIQSPVCSAFFSFEPDRRTVIDLMSIFDIGRWNMVDGWMDYGAFDFPYQQYMESFVDPLQPWKRGLEDKQYPYVPLIPYRTAESPAFVKRPWDFYCSWSDQGLLFYYFFMLQNTGGIIDPEDQSHEIVHFVSTF